MSHFHRLHVARDGVVLDWYYLSCAELALKSGVIFPTDFGCREGVEVWEPIEKALETARAEAGVKRRCTTAQKRYLEKLGYVGWKGMANEEASEIISNILAGYAVPSGFWGGRKTRQVTERQIEHLRDELYFTGKIPETLDEASALIAKLHDDPLTNLRQMYEWRLSEGFSCEEYSRDSGFDSKREYYVARWEAWWASIERDARELKIVPPRREQVPDWIRTLPLPPLNKRG